MSEVNFSLFEEKTLKKENVFSGKIINVHVDTVELSNSRTAFREVVDHVGGVCIIALTKDQELLFVNQFRYPYKEMVLELPAGKLESTDSPLSGGIRELQEETGAIGENYIDFGVVYPSPGFSSEKLYMYFCNVKEFVEPSPDDDEFLDVQKIPLSKCVEMVMRNEILDAKTQIGILKAHTYIKSLG